MLYKILTSLLVFCVLLFISKVPAQTRIIEHKISINQQSYFDCFSESLDFKIPILVDSLMSPFEPNDIRKAVNDKIKSIYLSWFNYSHNLFNGGDFIDYTFPFYGCDSASSSFSISQDIDMTYEVRRPFSSSFTSFEINVVWQAGGGGNGFSNDFIPFNLDLINNTMLTIDSLIDPNMKEKFAKYISNYLQKQVKEFLNADLNPEAKFNVFGKTGEATGSLTYVGFTLSSNNLILSYSIDYGRGNGINSFEVPLKDLKKFIKKDYVWLCE